MSRLLHKDEWRRLGSQTGASEVKQHKWFSKLNWGLLRNTQPPIVFSDSNGIDAVNFRNMKESTSLDLDSHGNKTATSANMVSRSGAANERSSAPGLRPQDDLFHQFSSVTLHYDGED